MRVVLPILRKTWYVVVQACRDITTTKVSISLASLFGAVTLLQLTLAAYQVEIDPRWGSVLLVLTILFAVGAVVALFWPQSNTQELRKVQVLLQSPQGPQDAALREYLDQVEQWVLDKKNPLAKTSSQDPRRALVREKTLRVLRELGPNQKGEVLRLLHTLGLICKESAPQLAGDWLRGVRSRKDGPIILLGGADFSGAYLVDMELRSTHLVDVNLRGADLSNAWLSDLAVQPGDLTWSLIHGGHAGIYEKPTSTSNLEGAVLSDAVLKRTILAGCNLLYTDLTGADLTGADLRGADLQLTRGLTQEQINRAHGGVNQQEPSQNTHLPAHLEAPTAWSKPIYEQRSEEHHGNVVKRLARSVARSLGLR